MFGFLQKTKNVFNNYQLEQMNEVQSQTFNPFNYATTPLPENNQENISDLEEKFDEIVTKGGKKVFKVDIGHFDKLCRKFKDKCDVRIKNLNGSDKEDFKLMVSYVRLLYGTNYYEHLHKKVERYFGDLDRVRPGTVGGYFGGCLASTSFDNHPGCAVSCAGSVPRPKDEEGWSFCDKAVIFADREKDGYKFSVLKEPEYDDELDPCYIFVEHTDLHDFEGFSREEKDELLRMGVDNLYLIGCDSNGTEYINLYDEVCQLKDVKHRRSTNVNEDKSNLGLALILIVIFLLLVVLFFGWRFWDQKGDGTGTGNEEGGGNGLSEWFTFSTDEIPNLQ